MLYARKDSFSFLQNFILPLMMTSVREKQDTYRTNLILARVNLQVDIANN